MADQENTSIAGKWLLAPAVIAAIAGSLFAFSMKTETKPVKHSKPKPAVTATTDTRYFLESDEKISGVVQKYSDAYPEEYKRILSAMHGSSGLGKRWLELNNGERYVVFVNPSDNHTKSWYPRSSVVLLDKDLKELKRSQSMDTLTDLCFADMGETVILAEFGNGLNEYTAFSTDLDYAGFVRLSSNSLLRDLTGDGKNEIISPGHEVPEVYSLENKSLSRREDIEHEIKMLYSEIASITRGSIGDEIKRASVDELISPYMTVDYRKELLNIAISHMPVPDPRNGSQITTLHNLFRDVYNKDPRIPINNMSSFILGIATGDPQYIMRNPEDFGLTYDEAERLNVIPEGRIIERNVNGMTGWHKVETLNGTMYKGPDGEFRYSVGATPVNRKQAVSQSYNDNGNSTIEYKDPVTGRTWIEESRRESRETYPANTTVNRDGSVTRKREVNIGRPEYSHSSDPRNDPNSRHYEKNRLERTIEDMMGAGKK